jgi:hypothetical protein
MLRFNPVMAAKYQALTRAADAAARAADVHDGARPRPATAPGRLWLTDVTQHRTGQGRHYCAVVLDVYSRRVVDGPSPTICAPSCHRSPRHGPVAPSRQHDPHTKLAGNRGKLR